MASGHLAIRISKQQKLSNEVMSGLDTGCLEAGFRSRSYAGDRLEIVFELGSQEIGEYVALRAKDGRI